MFCRLPRPRRRRRRLLLALAFWPSAACESATFSGRGVSWSPAGCEADWLFSARMPFSDRFCRFRQRFLDRFFGGLLEADSPPAPSPLAFIPGRLGDSSPEFASDTGCSFAPQRGRPGGQHIGAEIFKLAPLYQSAAERQAINFLAPSPSPAVRFDLVRLIPTVIERLTSRALVGFIAVVGL